MKRYISSANKFTNKATQLASKAFSEKEILKRSLVGQHKGEPMMQVFLNIINDPNIEIADPDNNGNYTLYYKGENAGWINPDRFMGWIDDKIYQKLDKFDASSLSYENADSNEEYDY